MGKRREREREREKGEEKNKKKEGIHATNGYVFGAASARSGQESRMNSG